MLNGSIDALQNETINVAMEFVCKRETGGSFVAFCDDESPRLSQCRNWIVTIRVAGWKR